MAKKSKEGFSPEFEKVMEAIKNWRAVNREGKSFIASFVVHDDKANPIKDTMLLGLGYKDVCEFHLEVFKKALDEAELEDGGNFIDW